MTLIAKVTKEVQLEDNVKFIAKYIKWEVNIVITGEKYYLSHYKEIFENWLLDIKLQNKYDNFIEVLSKFNKRAIYLEIERNEGDWVERDAHNKDVARFIDNYGELLFEEIVQTIRFHPDYNNVTIEYKKLIGE